MRPIIGQKRLVDALFGHTLETVPKTMIFLGQSGCGKSWVAAAFAEHLGLDFENIDLTDISTEQLQDYYRCPLEKFYFIDLKGITEKQQNKILKFIEEPSKNMHVILMAESEIGVLPTILNRCVKYYFEPYSIEDLKQFDWTVESPNNLVFAICKTPGDLSNFDSTNVGELYDLCKKVVLYTSTANYANTISLITKINCKDDYKKFDLRLFLDMLEYVSFEDYKASSDMTSLNIYLYVIDQKKRILNKAFAKESFVLNFFDGLWRLTH